MAQTVQPSFGKGEIAPSLYGRVDTAMYGVALKTARNIVIHTHGGASNRGGLRYRAPAMDMGARSFLVPFHFNNTDKYLLEFGQQTMRVIRDGAHVTNDPQIIQGLTNASQGVITSTSHGLSDGQEIYVFDISGMTELNGRRFNVEVLTVDTFGLVNVFTGDDVDTTGFTPYTGGGAYATIYEVDSPWILDHLVDLKYVQAADVMTFVHREYPIYELARFDHDNWVFSVPDFTPRTSYPTGVVVTAGRVGNYRARYKVTAVGDDESLPGVNDEDHPIFAISAITNASPAEVTTSTDHGLSTGDRIYITDVEGMTELNERYFDVTVVDADQFTLDGEDSSAYEVYTTGGNIYRTFTVITATDPVVCTWRAHGLQTDDEIEINGVEGMTELNGRRFLIDKLTADTFELRDEDGSNYTAFSDGGYWQRTYGEVLLNNISGITQANPAVVTIAGAHGLSNGVIIKIKGVVGMTEVNEKNFTTASVGATTVTLENTNSTGFGAYSSGGSLWQDNTSRNTITWDAVAGADHYRIYKEKNGRYGFVGQTNNLSFTEDNIAPDTLDGPPSLRNPFRVVDSYPGAVGYFEQRRVFGGSFNEPDTSYYSVTGSTSNFAVHSPIQDDDAITATLASQEVNEIRHFVPLQDLLILTSASEWRATAGPDSAFTPTGLKQKAQTYFGCSNLKPLLSGNTVLFSEASKANVRSLSYSFQIDGFTGTDVGLLAPHMLYDKTISDWSWAGNPDNRIHIVRSDGHALTVTFDEEQNVTAWTTWDTDGFFESVATLRRGEGEHHDSVFFCVKRNINGNEVRFIEEWDQTAFTDVEDCFFVDAGSTYDVPVAIETVTVAPDGTVTVTAPGHGLEEDGLVDITLIEWEPEFDENYNQTNPDQLEGRFTVINVSGDTFTVVGEDGSDWNAYVRGGFVRKPVTRISGFDYLAGETDLVGLLDGNTVSGLEVDSDGVIELPHPTSRAHIGLRFISDMETLDIEAPGGATLQGHMKRINFVVVKFERTRGLLIGPNSDHMFELKQRDAEVYGEPTRLLTGNTAPIFLESAWNSNGRIFMRQRYPLPFTVLSIIPNFEVGTREDS
jgi:hypothetical protein